MPAARGHITPAATGTAAFVTAFSGAARRPGPARPPATGVAGLQHQRKPAKKARSSAAASASPIPG